MPYATWQQWTSTGATSTTVWNTWVSNSTSTTITIEPWMEWITSNITCVNGSYYVRAQQYPGNTEEAFRPPSVEEIQRHEARLLARREADARARELLLEHLDEAQRAEYERDSRFHLIVGDKTYRIERGWSGNVKLVAEDGVPSHSYCIHPHRQVPVEDNLLAQKLLLESDEETFLQIANETRMRVA